MANITTSFSVVAAAAVIMLTLSAGAAAPAAPAPAPIGKPGCETTCGKVSVPFPFGMGPARCSATGFNLTCDKTRPGPPRLLLGNDSSCEVQNIWVKERTIRVARRPIFSRDARNISSSGENGRWGGGGLSDQYPWQYMLSTGNDLVLAGCNVQAMLSVKITSDRTAFVSACSTYCDRSLRSKDLMFPRSAFNSLPTGFCNTSINGFYSCSSYDVELKLLRDEDDALKADNPPVYVLIAESGWFNAKRAIDLMNLEKPLGARHARPKTDLPVPVILNWACPNDGSCNSSVSTHSSCAPVSGGTQFLCDCDDGYAGNPYLAGGCQDIDECKRPKEYGCFGECANTEGSFVCWCPRGYQGNATLPSGCVKSAKKTGLIVGLSVGIGQCLMLLVLGGIFIIHKLKHLRAERLKQKFFRQNRGQLLQQLVSHRSDIGERMIIQLKELEKATNNFDQTRKVGRGGHGTVYKGILSDLHVVAIKRSNIVVQREIDEFINEVAILSQINHRNVVKLHGCCLETEVPLLAYEFISNGTLDDHLHRKSQISIPWVDRLRIATEVGKAIAYLHSAVSIPVIHRDIKSSNILLDDTFTAKISDFGASRYIPINQTGITATAVQGTIGYLDPMYYYTGRLSEKSDVYSFGVLLVELLTRKMPIMYRSSEGDGLVVQFIELSEDGNLVNILDSQVVEEGDSEVEEVAALAASCIKLRGDDRPTMRQVEMALEGIHAIKVRVPNDFGEERRVENYIATSYPSTRRSTSFEEVSRRYSQEDVLSLSAKYPR